MRHMDEGRLQAWLDGPRGGLSEEERAQVAAHLETCAECAGLLEALRALDVEVEAALAGVAGDDEEIPDFGAVRARAGSLVPGDRRNGDGAGGSSSRGRRLAPAWAATILVALGAGWLWNEMTRTGLQPGLMRPGGEAVREAVEGADAPERADGVEIVPETGSALSPDISIPPPPEVSSSAEGVAERAGTEVVTNAPGARDEIAAGERRAASAPAGVPERSEVAAGAVSDEAASANLARADTPVARARVEAGPEWRVVTAEEAEAFAGFRPRLVPGLPVDSVSVMGVEVTVAVVRVVQRLEGGGRLVLLQTLAEVAPDVLVRGATRARGFSADFGAEPGVEPETDETGAARGTPVEVSRTEVLLEGAFRITALAAVPADSLQALVRRLR